MDIAEVSVNKTCCAIINKLLHTLDCLSAPISDLTELFDGSALVEIMECFDMAFGIYYKRESNNAYIKRWLTKQGIYLGRGRSIDEILRSDHRSHIAMLCFAIATVFINNDQYLCKSVKAYRFNVEETDMIAIILYTKWKLCEEEVDIKQTEILKQNNEIQVNRNENNVLREKIDEQNAEIMSLRAKISELLCDARKTEEEHKILVARLIAELSHEKFKSKNIQIDCIDDI